jgi:Transposase DDE domain
MKPSQPARRSRRQSGAIRFLARLRGFAAQKIIFVNALDSTTVDLCLNLFPWARFRSTKAAIKLHTLLDLRGPIPTFIEITDGRCHDVNALDVLVVEPGAFYVMDRGYLDFFRLHTLHQAGAYFVIRAKKDLHFLRYVSQPVDPDTGLCSDHIGRLGGFYSRKDFPDKLRLVRFYDSLQDRRFCFLHQSSPAPGANYLPALQDALAGRTVLQVDQAASANQALLWKLDERGQDSGLDRGGRLRAGGDLEEGASTTAKFTQHFTNFKREHVRESASKSATYNDTKREL